MSVPARVKWLAAPSSPDWLERAIAHPDLVLIDHAHCERKAAGVALQLMFRYPGDGQLGEVLSPLAREELEHFEQVLELLQRRGIPLRPLPAPGYGAALSAAVRKGEPERMLDSFLVAGLIEARSHERMGLLAAHSPDAELRALYGDLLASEARHFGLYWLLAESRYGREVTAVRLEQLAAVELSALDGPGDDPAQVRMHSAGVRLNRRLGENAEAPSKLTSGCESSSPC
ncbi:MAG: tRNA-(ms[2]io[6]A)-hydroxylase [Synechococcus sp.]|nr:tRNA-(ms[2]io[6]A)-hydroxylase [Synechococcus sp.]